MAETTQTLSQVYDLIEAEKLEEARALLQPIVAREQNNADAWWLYAHAVSDPAAARTALQNVVRIDPNYTGARDLLATLDERFPQTTAAPSPTAPPPPPLTLPKPVPAAAPTQAEPINDPDFLSDDFDLDSVLPSDDDADTDPDLEDEDLEGDQPRRGLPLPFMIAGVLFAVVLLVGLLWWVLNMLLTPPTTGETTQVVDNTTPTTEAGGIAPTLTAEVVPLPTEEVPTEEPAVTETEAPLVLETEEPLMTPEAPGAGGGAVNDIDALLAEFADYELDRAPTEEIDSELGTTLVIRLCSTPAQLQQLATTAMITLGENSTLLGESYDAAGIAFISCETDLTLRVLGVTLEQAQSFEAGETSRAEYQRSWRPLR